jgi:hypothetical protein
VSYQCVSHAVKHVLHMCVHVRRRNAKRMRRLTRRSLPQRRLTRRSSRRRRRKKPPLMTHRQKITRKRYTVYFVCVVHVANHVLHMCVHVCCSHRQRRRRLTRRWPTHQRLTLRSRRRNRLPRRMKTPHQMIRTRYTEFSSDVLHMSPFMSFTCVYMCVVVPAKEGAGRQEG